MKGKSIVKFRHKRFSISGSSVERRTLQKVDIMPFTSKKSTDLGNIVWIGCCKCL